MGYRRRLLNTVYPDSTSSTSIRLTEHIELEDIFPSIGSVGDAHDNALMESVNGLYKAECIRTLAFHDGPYKTIADVEYATAGWVDWYNVRSFMARWETSRPSSSSKPTTLLSTESRNPCESGREPGALQCQDSAAVDVKHQPEQRHASPAAYKPLVGRMGLEPMTGGL